ncbi:hypothetical protein FH972_009645 [Carpinus fangiana]|uniref:Uncharacterized protein n=1 Tax=Carpinus fangiana TaxID=176857 RepID=A0A660KNM2_9ROSI|nr:hypothetical protein FH972_009645 [Carpinus fangiana]
MSGSSKQQPLSDCHLDLFPAASWYEPVSGGEVSSPVNCLEFEKGGGGCSGPLCGEGRSGLRGGGFPWMKVARVFRLWKKCLEKLGSVLDRSLGLAHPESYTGEPISATPVNIPVSSPMIPLLTEADLEPPTRVAREMGLLEDDDEEDQKVAWLNEVKGDLSITVAWPGTMATRRRSRARGRRSGDNLVGNEKKDERLKKESRERLLNYLKEGKRFNLSKDAPQNEIDEVLTHLVARAYYKDWLTEGVEAPSLPSVQIPPVSAWEAQEGSSLDDLSELI